MQRRVIGISELLACALAFEAALVLLHFARDAAQQVAFVLLSYAVGGAVLAWLLVRLHRVGSSIVPKSTLVFVIAAGVMFRLTLLPLAPATTQDVQRYLWEGLVQLDGHSPLPVGAGQPGIGAARG